MKKILIVLGVLFLACVAMIITMAVIAKSWELPDDHFVDFDLQKLADGTYLGEYAAAPLQAVVEVEVKDHKITNISIKKHKNFRGKPAEKIVEAIISHQSLNVELISGATLSSKVIRNAVEQALNNR